MPTKGEAETSRDRDERMSEQSRAEQSRQPVRVARLLTRIGITGAHRDKIEQGKGTRDVSEPIHRAALSRRDARLAGFAAFAGIAAGLSLTEAGRILSRLLRRLHRLVCHAAGHHRRLDRAWLTAATAGC